MLRERGGLNASVPIKDIETIEQIKKLYKAKNDIKGLLLFLLAINTGAKLKILLDLNIGDIKGKQHLVIDNKKSIPLNDEIKQLVQMVTAKKSSGEPLFTCYKSSARMDRATVFYRFREICKELALDEHITVASWRKTFGYHYYIKYKDLSYLLWYFSQSSVEAAIQYIGADENMNLRYKEGVSL